MKFQLAIFVLFLANQSQAVLCFGGGSINGLNLLESITITEDGSTEPSGLLIFTNKNNFALFSPNLTAKNWLAFDVRNDEMNIITLSNKTLKTKFSSLSEPTRKLLDAIKSTMLENLAGLSFSQQQASSSETNYQQLYPPNANSVVYNNIASSKLNETLSGDVYHINVHCNALDIYSSTVKARRLFPSSLTFFRDYRYFAYSRPNLPYYINTIFLHGNLVFFIYNDATVVVKAALQLNDVELDLVVEARSYMKELMKLEENAVEIQLGEQHQEAEKEAEDVIQL